jgi:predicted phosphodiesterase
MTGGPLGSGGVAPSGGTGSGGAPGTGGGPLKPTAPNMLVAFIGDQGNGAAADQVLELIKSEGALATVHNGDFDYESNPGAWDDRVTRILGASYPYFAVIGNHDAAAWNGPDGYAAKIAARTARVPDMSCKGELGVKASCSFRGLSLVESCIGTSELRPSCGKDSAEQVSFLRDALSSSNALWKVCNWHKNQHDLQVGLKTDEVGYLAYQECMNAGALVVTGHEHSYARTRTLSRIGLPLSGHGAAGKYDFLQLAPGQTFVVVSGLGGASIRPFDPPAHEDDTWWA